MSELDELKQQLAEIQAEIEKLEKKENWEMKCPFEKGDEYYYISDEGLTTLTRWNGGNFQKGLLERGNIFLSWEAAELEKKRRNLLTRFRAFRDECNGDWKPEYKTDCIKFHINFKSNGKVLSPYSYVTETGFNLFGYFKNVSDAERAIELFGDEIIKLFVEAE